MHKKPVVHLEDERSTPVEHSKIEDLSKNFEKGEGTYLTDNQGLRISDDQNSLRAGARGPTLLEDHLLREKITHFDHERIPERVVHARGVGAHGHFQAYPGAADLTMSKFLTDPSAKTPVFVRFSTVAGSRGSADTARDVRGFAVKFYTEEGVFDLVGNNIPVFFIQDAIKFPDLIHSVKPEPHNEIPQAASAHDTFWDFISLLPESMHMIMWVMSDRAIPRSLRMMEGFGIHTFRFVNAEGKSRFVKFHWKPLLGVHGLVWDEAQKLAGKDADFHRRDLWEAIEMGDYPEWEFGVQVIEEEDELKFPFDILDATKLWPEELIPVRLLGKMTLDRNPDNYFAETEQVAFHPGHVVPGIDFSNDPLLQGRLFSYLDTQISRMGTNFSELPINRPLAPVHNLQRDGKMRHTINQGKVAYEPNTMGGGCPMQALHNKGGYVSHPAPVSGPKVRERSVSFQDHFSQAALFYNSMTAPEKKHIAQALQFELGKVETKAIRQNVVALLANVDHELASLVADGIGVKAPAANGSKKYTDQSPALSMVAQPSKGVATRKVAILAAPGVDASSLTSVKKALKQAGVVGEVVSPSAELADKLLHTVASVMYDAVIVAGGASNVQTLAKSGQAILFVMEAFKHAKTIGAIGEGAELLKRAGIPSTTDPGVVLSKDGASFGKDFLAALSLHRHWARETESVPA